MPCSLTFGIVGANFGWSPLLSAYTTRAKNCPELLADHNARVMRAFWCTNEFYSSSYQDCRMCWKYEIHVLVHISCLYCTKHQVPGLDYQKRPKYTGKYAWLSVYCLIIWDREWDFGTHTSAKEPLNPVTVNVSLTFGCDTELWSYFHVDTELYWPWVGAEFWYMSIRYPCCGANHVNY